jgi:hypothetical protein
MRKLFRRECLGRSKDHVAGSVDDHVKPVIRHDDLFERSPKPGPEERANRGYRQQAGSYRLGGTVEW